MRFIHILDYFFVLRPILFFPGWTTTLAGYLAARNSAASVGLMDFNTELTLVCISSAMIMGAGFVVNQIKDKESDEVNQKLFFLADGITRLKPLVVEICLLISAALTIAASISHTILIIHILALLLIAVVYNLQPFALKDKTFGSFIANTLMGAFAFAFGWFVTDPSFVLFLQKALPYIFFNSSLYFLTTIPDAAGDKLACKKTICVVYGLKTTIYWAIGFEIVAVILSIVAMDWIILVPTLLTLPFYGKLLISRNVSSSILTIKFGLLFFSLVIGVFFPAYIVLILLFFFLTRFYYRQRFNLNYPNFKGE